MSADGDYVTGRWFYRKILRQLGVTKMSDLHQHVVISGFTTCLGVLVSPKQTSTGKVTVMTVGGAGISTLSTGVIWIPGISPPLRGSGHIWPHFSVHEEPIENVYLLDSPDPLLTEALSQADQYFRARPTPEGRLALKHALQPIDLFFRTIKGKALPPGKPAVGELEVETTLRDSIRHIVHL